MKQVCFIFQVHQPFRLRNFHFFEIGSHHYYYDEIGNIISDMGFKGVIVEGLFGFLNDQSHNYVYKSAEEASLKILLRNPFLSDDITLRFSNRNWSEWPLTADKYLGWLKGLPSQEQVVNLVMDYGTFGERHKKETGISNFLEYLLRYLVESKVLKLSTPEEVLRTFSPKGKLNIPDPISWTGMKKNLSAWLGNDMQKEAMDTLFGMEEAVKKTKDKLLHKDWVYLQSADHFLYMNNEGESGSNWYNPYEGPYEAFMKYMNVLSDFQLKLQDKTKTKSIRKNVNHKQL